MKIYWLIAILAASFALSACSNQSKSERKVMATSAFEEIGMPGPAQLPSLEREAMAGSALAAMQLSLWYMKFPSGENTDLYWTQIAAQNGSAAGQFNLGIKLLYDTSNPLNSIRARYWLRQSAKQHAEPAIAKLTELEKAP